MKFLFDQEEVMEMYVRDERNEAARERDRETAAWLIKMGKLSLEEISIGLPSLSIDELKKLEAEIMQPV